MEICPCGSELAYSACCEPIILGKRTAGTALELMRSRYSAYVKNEVDFIVESTFPAKRNKVNRKMIQEWAVNSQWHALKIIDTMEGETDDTTGTVEFIAEYTENGVRNKHHEIAFFKKLNNQWFFFDGKPPIKEPFKRDKPKVGRNSPCPCGSGKKFKKCCGS